MQEGIDILTLRQGVQVHDCKLMSALVHMHTLCITLARSSQTQLVDVLTEQKNRL